MILLVLTGKMLKLITVGSRFMHCIQNGCTHLLPRLHKLTDLLVHQVFEVGMEPVEGAIYCHSHLWLVEAPDHRGNSCKQNHSTKEKFVGHELLELWKTKYQHSFVYGSDPQLGR